MKLFRHLDVPLKPTSMSFSVRHLADDLEYCGSSLELLFVQRRNLFLALSAISQTGAAF